jgi:NAD-dependent dihydropyrimidine dehydrogenase PreA subunit
MARRHVKTEYLDTAKCTACGKCIEECSQQVLKLVGIKFIINHRHIKVDRPEECIGCLSCLEACPENAIKEIVSALDSQEIGGHP